MSPGTVSTVRFGDNSVAEIRHRLDPSSPRENNSAPTPGVDDTPYIRFAIDQLTRDEEITGEGRQGSVVATDYPVDRLVGDEGLGYFSQAPKPTSATATTKPATTKPATTKPATTKPATTKPATTKPATTKPSLTKPAMTTKPTTRPPPSPQYRPSKPERLIAVEPGAEDQRYQSLDYVPVVLRTGALVGFTLWCLLMVAAIASCNVSSQRNHGLWDYDGVGGSRYFVFEFLPQLLAILLVIWTFVIQAAIYRTIPFSMMASERQQDGVLQHLPILPQNFVLPDFSHFKHGEPLIGLSVWIFWLLNWFAVPLASCLFQPQYQILDAQGTWRWSAVQPVGWTLVALYSLLVIASVLLMFRFFLSWTGLRWDPVSLADLIPLIQRSNILPEFDRSEVTVTMRDFLPSRVLRLGYWRTADSGEMVYTIGAEDPPDSDQFLRPSRPTTAEKRPRTAGQGPVDLEQGAVLRDEFFERSLRTPFVRYRWIVWFLEDTFILAWIVIVLVLFIAFVLVSFLRGGIQHGFLPLLPTLPDPNGFSASNFLYSFLPSLIGNGFFLAWQPIDVYFRALQPFASMSGEGTSAENSLLLSYPACLPIEVTVLAFVARHYKVAWVSFMSIASLTLPVLSGGVFIALYYPSEGQVRISACLPAFYALVVFCAIYMLSFLVIWPRRPRYLPHDITTLADLISFLYPSSLLADKLLREPASKVDLVTRLVISAPGEKKSPAYGFGIYRGSDGKDHLGIDRVHIPGRTDMIIASPPAS